MFSRESRFKRSWLIGLATFGLGLAIVAAVLGFKGRAAHFFGAKETTATGKVTMYLLNGQGELDGLLLENGDQVRFSPQFGQAVAGQVKAGDEVTFVGHNGAATDYGREIRVRQITVNGNTLTDAGRPEGHGSRKGPHDDHKRGGHKRGGHGEDPDRPPFDEPQVGAAQPDAAQNQAPSGEAMKVTNTISRFLVNGRGEVDGMILSDGTQMRFGPKLGASLAAARTGNDTQATVEGWGVRNERGTALRPNVITVGTQTFALGK